MDMCICGHPWTQHQFTPDGGLVECWADDECDCVLVQPCGVYLGERIEPEYDLGGESG